MLYETREDITTQLDQIGDHINSNIAARDTKIGRELQQDFLQTTNDIQQGQHARNRDVIREIVESCGALKDGVNEKFNTWRDMENL